MLKVLLTGGGTGGHIYPALAVARRLKSLSSDVEILYIGTKRGLESELVPDSGFDFETIEIEGFKRRLDKEGILYNIHTLKLLFKSFKRAKQIINEFNPDVVLGTGGYVAGPVCLVAARLGIPTIVHEQNSVIGLTNKLLAHFVDKIAICFDTIYDQIPKFKDKIIFTGNPRAQEIADIKPDSESLTKLGLDNHLPTLLVVGGSRGAEAINEAIVQLSKQLSTADFQTIFVTGEIHYKQVCERVGDLSKNSRLLIVPYLSDMIHILANVDLVVTRSGATTISEITALGIPSILIPSPYVTANHQMINAQSLVDHHAAVLIKESELSAERLIDTVNELIYSEEKLSQMREAAKSLGHPKAADQLIDIMLNLVQQGG